MPMMPCSKLDNYSISATASMQQLGGIYRVKKIFALKIFFSPLTYWPSFVIKTAHKNLIRESIVYLQFPFETCCRAP
jgi:hypothetical protein